MSLSLYIPPSLSLSFLHLSLLPPSVLWYFSWKATPLLPLTSSLTFCFNHLLHSNHHFVPGCGLFPAPLWQLRKGVKGQRLGLVLTSMKNRRKLCFTINLWKRGQCVGSVPAAGRHAAHPDFSSRVIGLIKSSPLPGPTDQCGVGGQTADGCAAQTESAHSGGAGGSDSDINSTSLPTQTSLGLNCCCLLGCLDLNISDQTRRAHFRVSSKAVNYGSSLCSVRINYPEKSVQEIVQACLKPLYLYHNLRVHDKHAHH